MYKCPDETEQVTALGWCCKAETNTAGSAVLLLLCYCTPADSQAPQTSGLARPQSTAVLQVGVMRTHQSLTKQSCQSDSDV